MFRFSWTGLLLAILPLTAFAAPQATKTAAAETATPKTATPKTTGELTKDVERLSGELEQLRQQLADVSKSLTKTASQVEKNSEAASNLIKIINEEATRQQQIIERLEGFDTQLADQFERQQRILEAITEKDNSGQDILSLRANMEKSEDFRRDVDQAVHKSLRTEGSLTIVNKMGTYQQVSVNQANYHLAAGETITLSVPVGTVSVQLPGQGITNWTVNAPKYNESIDIVPNSNWTVAKVPTYVTPPLAPVYVPPAPIYISPPITWSVPFAY